MNKPRKRRTGAFQRRKRFSFVLGRSIYNFLLAFRRMAFLFLSNLSFLFLSRIFCNLSNESLAYILDYILLPCKEEKAATSEEPCITDRVRVQMPIAIIYFFVSRSRNITLTRYDLKGRSSSPSAFLVSPFFFSPNATTRGSNFARLRNTSHTTNNFHAKLTLLHR